MTAGIRPASECAGLSQVALDSTDQDKAYIKQGLAAVGLDDEVFCHRLEQVWVVRHGPVDAPEGFPRG